MTFYLTAKALLSSKVKYTKQKKERYLLLIYYFASEKKRDLIKSYGITNREVDYTTIAGRLRTVSQSDYSHPTGVGVYPFYGTHVPTHRNSCIIMGTKTQISLNGPHLSEHYIKENNSTL